MSDSGSGGPAYKNKAFVVLSCDFGDGDRIGKEVRESFEGAQGVRLYGMLGTYGAYDFVLESGYENPEDFYIFLAEKIRKIRGVQSTMTLISTTYEKENKKP